MKTRLLPLLLVFTSFAFSQSKLEKIVTNREQNQKLVELRDWLLPMLMNGQVKVE